ncbi:MAG: hypothetical protein IPL35_13555 [Sphingobacteriales bacterium]|nr:hypothetical protein [Sphingobacteriales bacterium]
MMLIPSHWSFRKFIFSTLLLLHTLYVVAQTSAADSLATAAPALKQQPEMADIMRSNGKIYVVVAILLLLFVGIALYLLFIESQVKQIEKELKNNKNNPDKW